MDKNNINNTLKSVVKNTVELAYYHVVKANTEEFCAEDAKEYEKYSNRCEEIYQILINNLPEKFKKLIDEFDDIKMAQTCINERFYFKQGVITGLTDLKYLEEVGQSIVMI